MALRVHESKEHEYTEKGWVKQDGWLYDPERYCLRAMRSGYRCTRERDHKGFPNRCASTTFYCDGCSKVRVGRPTSEVRNSYDDVIEVVFCFLCTRENANYAY